LQKVLGEATFLTHTLYLFHKSFQPQTADMIWRFRDCLREQRDINLLTYLLTYSSDCLRWSFLFIFPYFIRLPDISREGLYFCFSDIEPL